MDEKPLNSETYNNITIISQDDVAEKNPTTESGDIVQTATRKNIGAKATTFLIMLLSLLAGCLSFHYIWHFHD
ncbi:transcriptional regulator, partial [Klebsiella pneumoniae]